jgi:regulator of sigma E protease
MTKQAASDGLAPFVGLIGLLSVSIGLINLFPIPILDGGHLVFYAVEALRGRPLGQQAQEWSFRIGLSLVLMLIAFGLWNDITRHLS